MRRPLLPRLASTLALALALGCSPASTPRCPDAAVPASASVTAASSASAPPIEAGPHLAITLSPASDGSHVEVTIVARGSADELRTWSIAAPDAGAVTLLDLHDDRGPLVAALGASAGPHPLATARGLTLPRAAAGAVHLRYSVASRHHPLAAPATVDLDPNRMEASGEALLLLPDAFDDHPIATAITVRTDGFGDTIGVASSAGVGASRELRARGLDLRFSTFLIGPMGRGLFETQEGHDEAAWFGYTAFDPRPIAADVAAFRTAVGNLFGARAGESLTLLIVADARPPGAFQVTRRASSVLAHVGVGEPWSGAVRISVAAEVIHGWIGGRLWIGPDDPAHEAEARWFTEGVTRHLARDLLFRFGLITNEELLDEVHGLHGVLATSPRKAESNASLAQHAREPGVAPLLVARGALYATRIDALLRAKSGGKEALPELLRALFDEAQKQRAALPTEAWVRAVSAKLGADEAQVFAAMIGEGKPIELPTAGLGPCFRAAKRTYRAFDLGFDEEGTRLAEDRAVKGLRPGGPAERAGVKEGDRIVDTVLKRGRSDVPVELHLERGSEKKTIRYLPAGASGEAQGWSRKKDVPDDACTR